MTGACAFKTDRMTAMGTLNCHDGSEVTDRSR